jgi:carbonic anhydrase/acetyltransferase-like protein (isoleucine patch superfamily)
MIRAFKGVTPRLGKGVYVDPSAQIIGDVELGDHASIWMNAVIRGDVHSIRIGAFSNIQDNCVVHVYKETHPTVVADHVTVGHSATVHGCRVDPYCLIGMAATLLNGCHIGEGSIVAAGTLVPEGMVVPPGSLVMGVPAKVRRPVTPEEREGIARSAQSYAGYKDEYLAEPKP